MSEAVFYFEASPLVGLGHAMRCAALSASLRQLGWHTTAIIGWSAGSHSELWQSSFDVLLTLDEPEVGPTAFQIELPSGCDVLVIDRYSWTEGEETQCRRWARRIVIIADIPDRRHDADILICPSLGSFEMEFSELVPKTCDILIGAQYALISGAIEQRRPQAAERRRHPGAVERILVTLGGGRLEKENARVIEGVHNALPHAAIDLVLPERSESRHELSGAATIHVGTPQLPDLMLAADIAIGAAGVNALERCCLGLPSIVVITAENQRPQAQALADHGLVAGLMTVDELSLDAVCSAVGDLASDGARRHLLANRGMTAFDGRGVVRAAKKIDGLPKETN